MQWITVAAAWGCCLAQPGLQIGQRAQANSRCTPAFLTWHEQAAQSVGWLYLSGRLLPHHALRDGSCLQRIVKTKASDVRVCSYAFYSGQVLDIGIKLHICHAACP